ncbi:MAG: EAL domain-containing protein [Gammaproteobacteria bacterium]|jgi:diguanylate cyclase (GGDEF)-like protein/PAS domain S-box-containing protein|nr:EAL domain-containing protein [Gammaproteobacteria bacterium]
MRWNSSPAWIILVYLAFGSLWIILSDWLLGLLARDAAQLVQWQQYKGIAFIVATALLLYGMLAVRQRQLARSEARFLATFDQAAVGIAQVAPDGRWLRVNRKLCTILGYSADELVARSFQDLTHPEDLSADLDLLRSVLAGKRDTYALEKRYQHKDGHLFWANLTVSLVRDARGRPDYFVSVIEDIDGRKQAERDLQESEARQRLFIQHAPAALAMFDTELRFLMVSDRWLKDFSLTAEDLRDRGHYEVFPEIPQRWREAHQRALRGEVLRADSDYFIRPDGRTQWQRWEVRPWYKADQSIGGIVIFAEDITLQKEAEREMRIAATAFETRQAMLITNDAQRILRVNQAFCETTGYRQDEVIGQTPALLKSGRHDAAFYSAMWQDLREHGQWQGEIWNRRKNGQIYPAWLHISRVLDEEGRVSHYVGAFEDLSAHKQAEAQIHSLSYFDVLTKLPNRRLFIDRLEQALRTSERARRHGAVFFIDLDDFSALNDTQGHDIGDKVLLEVARNLVAAVGGDDTVARLGSDEFVVIIENLDAQTDPALLQAKEAGDQLLAAIRQPIQIGGSDYVMTASMGISLFDGRSDSVTALLKRADAAMLQVKKIGRNCLHFFDSGMQLALEHRVELEALLRKAIPEQLRLYYQPQVDTEGRTRGAEVLVRWQDPDKGLISPGDFIPLAEESGLILPMGQWILQSACEQLAHWKHDPVRQRLSLSVNVSAKQFQQPNFVSLVADTLDASGADPARLKLEITESLLFDDLDRVTETMAQLKARGIRLSLDDFGTGFSSLAYLRSLPVDELKIDQSFVRELSAEDSNAAIVRTITTLGQSLGLDVIAEGVETESARQFLRAQGCSAYQGFYFARPMPIDELERFLHSAATRN